MVRFGSGAWCGRVVWCCACTQRATERAESEPQSVDCCTVLLYNQIRPTWVARCRHSTCAFSSSFSKSCFKLCKFVDVLATAVINWRRLCTRMCCNNARPGAHHRANFLQNLQLWERRLQICRFGTEGCKNCVNRLQFLQKRVQRALLRASMYKTSARSASERYFSFIGSRMVLIYFCLTLHTTQAKSPNTAVFALLHLMLSALLGVFWIGSANNIAANLKFFFSVSWHLQCSKACLQCSFLAVFVRIWGWWGPAADVQSTLPCFRRETYARSSCTVRPQKV